MCFLDITRRRQRQRTFSEITNESVCTTQPLDGTSSSLPEISDDESNSELIKLQDRLENITRELQNAHTEIKSLTLENYKLKSINEELVKKKDLFRQIATSPISKPKSKTKANILAPKIHTTESSTKSSKQTQTEANTKPPHTQCTPSTINTTESSIKSSKETQTDGITQAPPTLVLGVNKQKKIMQPSRLPQPTLKRQKLIILRQHKQDYRNSRINIRLKI